MAAEFDLQQLCVDLTSVALEAGRLIRDAGTQRLETWQSASFSSKKNTADIVTETDQASEELIHRRLTTKYSSIRFIGEESFKAGRDRITDEPTFVVDPVDGTSNFVHGLPEVCVSIGLVIDRRPAVGVVHNPFTGELWTAARGHGAYYQQLSLDGQSNSNGSSNNDSSSTTTPSKKLRLPLFAAPLLLASEDGTSNLGSACIGIEFGSDRQGPDFELNLGVFTALARTHETGGMFANSLRSIGSAALAICRVAGGQQEAFWECGCWAWDVAAAWCILDEAGGVMADGQPRDLQGWDLQPPPIDNRRYLAVRPAVPVDEGGDGGGVSAREQQREFVNLFWHTLGHLGSTYGPPQP